MKKLIVVAFSMLIMVIVIPAQPVLTLTPVITTGLNSPIQLVNAADGSNRIFIVQQGGTILVYNFSYTFLSTFLTVSNISTGGERGLLSMAFHPNYETNGFFYVYYTNASGNLELARYHVSGSPNIADASSKVILITIPHPGQSNHNGGELHFGKDGFLYLSTGDGGGAGDVPNNAQNTSVLLGKMLRFNVNTSATAPYYTIPAGNPFNNEIYDLGLRNPFRWSFDRQTGDIWIGDVGQGAWEEINFRAAGASPGVNYGWRCYEGNTPYNTTGCGPASSYVFPASVYPNPSTGSAAVTGGIVYRGASYPALHGWYISADFYSGVFYKIISNGAGGWNTSTQTFTPTATGIADFGETENGEAYAVSLTGNSVHRIGTTAPSLTLNLTALIQGFYTTTTNTMISDVVTVQLRNNTSPYAIVATANGTLSTSGTATVAFTAGTNGVNYYIVVKHRNSIETWSTPVSFTAGSLSYNFTTAANKAFGSNLILKGTKWCVYSGDVNQDGTVDLNDMTPIDNDAFNFATGYRSTDVNGDQAIDLNDMTIVDNNSFNFISLVRP